MSRFTTARSRTSTDRLIGRAAIPTSMVEATANRTLLVLLLLAALLVVPAGAAPAIDGVTVFPNDHIWNARVDSLPVDPDSALYVSTIGAARTLHADFGSGLWEGTPIGIPYVTVPGTQPKVPVAFEYADESDPAPTRSPRRPDRGRLRSPYPRPRPGPPAPVRGVCGREAAGRLVACRLGRGLRSRLLRAPARGVYLGRCCRARDPARTRPLRRGCRRRDRPRDPVHGAGDPPRLCLARAPLRLEPDGRPVPADGPAISPPGRLQHLDVLAGGPGGAPGPEGVRHGPRGQRLALVSLGSARLPVEQRSSRRTPAGARVRLRGRRRLVPDGGPRLGPCSAGCRYDPGGCRPSARSGW